MHTEMYQRGPAAKIPNSRFPLLVYREAMPGGGANAIIAQFRENGWLNNWKYPGIYTYGHFHSTTHECLGCAAGWMEIVLFGDGGEKIKVEAGDVIVLPAGVSHRMVQNSEDNLMVGGYPGGCDWDNIQEAFLSDEDFRSAVKRIMMLPIPTKDPVTGLPLHSWIEATSSVDGGWNDFRDGLDRKN